MGLLPVLLLAVANPYFVEGQRLHRELHFAEAVEQLKVAAQVPGLSDAEKVTVLDLLAQCLAADGRPAEAQTVYEQLLAVSWAHAPDRSLSPKLLEPFDAAKRRLFPKDYLSIEPLASPVGVARLKVVDPWSRASAFRLFMRGQAQEEWIETVLGQLDGALNVPLAGPALSTLEWYVLAVDGKGEPVGSYGSAEKPKRHVVPEATPQTVVERRVPRVQRWPAWVAVVVGAAALGVGAVFQFNSSTRARTLDDRSQPPGDWADTARAAHGLATRDAAVATSLFALGGVAVGVGTLVFIW